MSETRGEMLATETFGKFVKRRFTDGLIRKGAHEPNGLACVLEARNVAVKGEWTDNPNGFPDLRRLNDGRWASDEERTAHMIPLVEALWDWKGWDEERKVAWAKTIAKRTIQEILPPMLRRVNLNDAADRCEKEGTRKAALFAKQVAAAAYAAAYAAAAAAAAAAASTKTSAPLILLCRIMIESAKESANG